MNPDTPNPLRDVLLGFAIGLALVALVTLIVALQSC